MLQPNPHSKKKNNNNAGLTQSLKRVQPKLCSNQAGLPQDSVTTVFTLQIRCKSDCVVTVNLLDGAILAQGGFLKGKHRTKGRW